jgi:hypothetical protein
MSELRRKYLEKVIIVRDGSTSDGLHGLVTQIIEDSETPLIVLLWATQGFKHSNYYAPSSVELTDDKWSDSLPRDQQVRVVFDSSYSHLYYIVDGKGRSIEGYGTPDIAWSHYFREHFDAASAALHTLVQEVSDDRTSDQRVENEQGTVANGNGAVPKSGACDDSVLGEGSEHAQSRAYGEVDETHGHHPQTVGTGARVTATKRTGER